MRKLFTFLSLSAIVLSSWATSTITIDGDASDWADVPMVSEPGTTPMLKIVVPQEGLVLPSGSAFSALLVDVEETTLAADGPVFYVDADKSAGTGSVPWFCGNMGYDYQLASWSGSTYAVDANKYEISVPQSAFSDIAYTGEFNTWMTYKWGNAENGGYYVPTTGEWSVSICYPMYVRPYTYRNMEGTITPAEMYSHHKALEIVDGKIYHPNSSLNNRTWASWAVEVTPGIYNVTAEIEAATASSVCVELVDLVTNEVVATQNTGNLWGKTGTVAVGEWDLRGIPAGKYMLKYHNVYQYAEFYLSSLTFTYAGGATTDIPAALALRDAVVYSPKAIIRTDASIKFVEPGYNTSSYIDFRIHLTTPGNYSVALGISTDNGHQMQAVLQHLDGTVIATLDEGAKYTTGDLTLEMGLFDMTALAAGDYVLRVQNAMNHSHAILTSASVLYDGGGVIALPATIMAADASFSARGSREGEYIVFPADASLPDDYITMNASVETAGTYQFTVHVSTTDYHQYKAIIRDASTGDVIDEVMESYGYKTNDRTFGTANLPVGDIVIELHQTNAWGHAKFASLEVTKVEDARLVYKLSISAAGYSTLVLPFDVPTLPTGVEVYRLMVSGDEILASPVSSLSAGEPVLVKAESGNYNFRSAYSALKDFTGSLVSGALHGTYSQIEAPLTVGGENVYVLQKHGDEVAFYQLDASSNKTINPYRAYLTATYNSLSAPSPAPMRIRFQTDTATDLEETAPAVSLDEALRDGKVYDLLGRRVYAIPAAGLYIVDGQKMFIR